MPGDPKRPARRDAARNRSALLVAARAVFAEHGHDAPLEEVARAASVSRATLYRHFATREELAATVYEDNLEHLERRAAELRDRPDGVVVLFDEVLDLLASHGTMGRVLTNADQRWFAALTARTCEAFRPLLDRGVAAGLVHPGTTVDDVLLALRMADVVTAEDDAGVRAVLLARRRLLLHRALFAVDRARSTPGRRS